MGGHCSESLAGVARVKCPETAATRGRIRRLSVEEAVVRHPEMPREEKDCFDVEVGVDGADIECEPASPGRHLLQPIVHEISIACRLQHSLAAYSPRGALAKRPCLRIWPAGLIMRDPPSNNRLVRYTVSGQPADLPAQRCEESFGPMEGRSSRK